VCSNWKWSPSLPPTFIAHFEAGARKPDDPGLAEAGDPLYGDVAPTGNDCELARDFLKMLAERSRKRKTKRNRRTVPIAR
jgi:hypothetical protein